MDKYTYCFGCDGEFEASDGIASAKRSSYFDLVDDPDVSSEDLPKIKHFYALLGLRSLSCAGVQHEIRR